MLYSCSRAAGPHSVSSMTSWLTKTGSPACSCRRINRRTFSYCDSSLRTTKRTRTFVSIPSISATTGRSGLLPPVGDGWGGCPAAAPKPSFTPPFTLHPAFSSASSGIPKRSCSPRIMRRVNGRCRFSTSYTRFRCPITGTRSTLTRSRAGQPV